MAQVVIRSLNKKFDEVHAVKDVNLEIRDREWQAGADGNWGWLRGIRRGRGTCERADEKKKRQKSAKNPRSR